MPELNIVDSDINGGIGVAARNRVDQECITSHCIGRMMRIGIHPHFSAVTGSAATTSDGFRHNRGRRVRSHVNHLGSGILVLTRTRKRYGEGLALGSLPH